MNHNYSKSGFWAELLLPIALPFWMIDSVLEDLLPEDYLPPKLEYQVWGKDTAKELLSKEFREYYADAIHSGNPLPA